MDLDLNENIPSGLGLMCSDDAHSGDAKVSESGIVQFRFSSLVYPYLAL